MTLGLASCSDFLDETNRNAVTADVLYNTPDGYENLVNACYAYSKAFMGNTDGYRLLYGRRKQFRQCACPGLLWS